MSSVEQSFGVARTFAAHAVRPRGWLIRRGLLLADVVGLLLAFTITENIFGGVTHGQTFTTRSEVWLFLLSLPVWILLAQLYGLYDKDESRTDYHTVDDLGPVFHLTTVGTWIVVTAAHREGDSETYGYGRYGYGYSKAARPTVEVGKAGVPG